MTSITTSENEYKIFAVANYGTTLKKTDTDILVSNKCKFKCGSLDTITNELQNNKGYCERLSENDLLKFNIDIDGVHCTNEQDKNSESMVKQKYDKFVDNLIEYSKTIDLEITREDISYTRNNNFEKLKAGKWYYGSFHLTIPKYYANAAVQRTFW